MPFNNYVFQQKERYDHGLERQKVSYSGVERHPKVSSRLLFLGSMSLML